MYIQASWWHSQSMEGLQQDSRSCLYPAHLFLHAYMKTATSWFLRINSNSLCTIRCPRFLVVFICVFRDSALKIHGRHLRGYVLFMTHFREFQMSSVCSGRIPTSDSPSRRELPLAFYTSLNCQLAAGEQPHNAVLLQACRALHRSSVQGDLCTRRDKGCWRTSPFLPKLPVAPSSFESSCISLEYSYFKKSCFHPKLRAENILKIVFQKIRQMYFKNRMNTRKYITPINFWKIRNYLCKMK